MSFFIGRETMACRRHAKAGRAAEYSDDGDLLTGRRSRVRQQPKPGLPGADQIARRLSSESTIERSRLRSLAGLVSLGLLLGCGDDDATGPDGFLGCGNVATHTIGSTANGTLSNSSCIYVGDPTDFYRFQLSQAQTVTISLTSESIDAFLFLFGESGNGIRSNDDGGDGLNALIVEPLTAGTYVIGATSSLGEVGTYTLTTSQN